MPLIDPPRILYLAGPIGNPDSEEAWETLQSRAAYASYVQGRLLRHGYVTINPYSTGLDRRNWELDKEDWLEADRKLMELCDALVLLPGWQESEGVMESELPYARKKLLDIYIWDPEKEALCPLPTTI